MAENEPKQESIFKPLRASNTIATLRPTEVAGTAVQHYQYVELKDAPSLGDPLMQPDNVVNLTVVPVRKPEPEKEYAEYGDFLSAKVGKVIPCNNPKSVHFSGKSLEGRIQKLEEQMDGLLDRIARYNTRAAHRIE